MRASFAPLLAVLALGCTAYGAEQHHKKSSATCQTCYTPTTYITEIVPCAEQPTPCGPAPDCILLTSTVIPAKVCATTATLTTNQCKTCQTGCGTATTTITATGAVCPSPSSCSYSTVTETSGRINCPLEPACTTLTNCAKTTTVTQPSANPWCPFTPTVTFGPTCPTGDQVCCPTITKTVTQGVTPTPTPKGYGGY